MGINPAWVTAPYKTYFLFRRSPRPRHKNWSRWRQLKWLRRWLRKGAIGPDYVTAPIVWKGRVTGGYDVAPWCKCKGDPKFFGHRSDCAYANGN